MLFWRWRRGVNRWPAAAIPGDLASGLAQANDVFGLVFAIPIGLAASGKEAICAGGWYPPFDPGGIRRRRADVQVLDQVSVFLSMLATRLTSAR